MKKNKEEENGILNFEELLGYYRLWVELGLEEVNEPTEEELRAMEEELKLFERKAHEKSDEQSNPEQR